MEARVLNSSSTENIYIIFKGTDDANTPDPSQSPISPGMTAKRTVHSATMNLFVWTDPTSVPIWSGVVPTKVQKVIIVSPEKKEVSYDGVILPSGFSPITDPTELVGRSSNASIFSNMSNIFVWIMLFIILAIVVAMYLFWWKRDSD